MAGLTTNTKKTSHRIISRHFSNLLMIGGWPQAAIRLKLKIIICWQFLDWREMTRRKGPLLFFCNMAFLDQLNTLLLFRNNHQLIFWLRLGMMSGLAIPGELNILEVMYFLTLTMINNIGNFHGSKWLSLTFLLQ